MKKYKTTKTRNFSIGQDRDDRIIKRAFNVALESGWTEEEPKKGDVPNASKVVSNAIDCYFDVLELFGEDYKDALKIQSEPLYIKAIKENQKQMLEILKNVGSVTLQEQAEMIQQLEETMDIDGMLE